MSENNGSLYDKFLRRRYGILKSLVFKDMARCNMRTRLENTRIEEQTKGDIEEKNGR